MIPHFKYFMGGFLVVFFLVLAFGCAGNYKPPENAQQAINEAKTVLVAAKEMIGDQVADGLITPDKAQKRLNQTRELEKDIRAAQSLLDKGLEIEAWDKAEIARRAVAILRRELAEEAQK